MIETTSGLRLVDFIVGQVCNRSVTHISGSLDRKPEEIAVRIDRRPPLQGDFWRRARPADAHAAEECRTVFRKNERVPAFFSGLRSNEAAQMWIKDRFVTCRSGKCAKLGY